MENERKIRSIPKPLKGIAQHLIAQWTKKVETIDQLYAEVWKDAVGERVSGHTMIDRIHKGKVYVIVENSMWMNELTFLKDQIKMNLGKAFANNGVVVEEIIFKLGMIRKNSELSSDVPPLGK